MDFVKSSAIMCTWASRKVASASPFLLFSELKSCTASVAELMAFTMSNLEQWAPVRAMEAMASPDRFPQFLQMLRASVACLRASRFSFMARLLLLCVTRSKAMSSCMPISLRMVSPACAAWLHFPYCSSARWMLAMLWSMPASHLLSSGVRSLTSRMNERPLLAMRRASEWSSFARFTATSASQQAAWPFLSPLFWKRDILSFTRRWAAPFSPSAKKALTTVPRATPSQPLSSPSSAKMFIAASAASRAS
mmetsp:Transcript_68870/g.213012  ORF Transcript_68870/g.213012 Transcript_68870/m.213012 type:complete len:250 (+) Transcript_68870:911-1660(+)